MKIISLKANKESFHDIKFKSGVNIIVGKKENTSKENDSNTYNGVGKSFVIQLVHFCLGSKKIKELEQKLPEWEFTLEFSIDDKNYSSTRSTSAQNKIFFCGEQFTVDDFNKKMLDLCFDLNTPLKYVTWRTLISRFIRRDRFCYVTYDTYIKKEQLYTKLINNSYLLGVNCDLISRKMELKEQKDSVSKVEKALKKDPFFKQYYLGDKSADIVITEKNEKINNLKNKLNKFEISQNYHELEKSADQKSNRIKKLENERSLININIENIKKSINQDISVNQKNLLDFYNSANIEIPQMIRKDINDVVNFHSELLTSRQSRLKEELEKNSDKLVNIDKKIKKLGEEEDELLGYLNSRGALEEYESLTKKLLEYKEEKNKASEYKDIISQYEDKKLDIKSKFISQEKETNDYLNKSEDHINKLRSVFYKWAKKFYPNKYCGLMIKNNEGDNKLRFDIIAKIEDDASDGINEVEIFCFDILILLSKIGKISFLFHDSRLLANMDPRQRKVLFQVVNELCSDNEVQYICSINEDTLQSVENEMQPKEFIKSIKNNIILELTDESPESKLLGVQVDINLEKN